MQEDKSQGRTASETNEQRKPASHYVVLPHLKKPYRARLPKSVTGGPQKWIGYFSTSQEAENAVQAAIAAQLSAFSSSHAAAASRSSQPVDVEHQQVGEEEITGGGGGGAGAPSSQKVAEQQQEEEDKFTAQDCEVLIKAWWRLSVQNMEQWGNVHVNKSAMRRAGL